MKHLVFKAIRAWALGIGLVVSACGSAGSNGDAGADGMIAPGGPQQHHRWTLQEPGGTRLEFPALLYLPAGYNAPENSNRRYPLLVFHPSSDAQGPRDGSQLRRVLQPGTPAWQIELGFRPDMIVVTPQLDTPRGSDGVWDLAWQESLLSQLLQSHRIDPRAIHVAGTGAGAGRVQNYARQRYWRLASWTVVSNRGAPRPVGPMTEPEFRNMASVPSWHVQNATDNEAVVSALLQGLRGSNPTTAPLVSYHCEDAPQVRLEPGECAQPRREDPSNWLFDPADRRHAMSYWTWLSQQRRMDDGTAPQNMLPNVNAGMDLTLTVPVRTTELSGTASDTDGAIVGWNWTQVSGPAVMQSGDRTPVLQLENPIAGDYVFRLTVTDDRGGTASDDVQLQVRANEPPPGPCTDTEIPISGITAVDVRNTMNAAVLLDGVTGYTDEVSWAPGWFFPEQYPLIAVLDLGRVYDVCGFRYFRGNSSAMASLEMGAAPPDAMGLPTMFRPMLTEETQGWNRWIERSDFRAVRTRYIQLQFGSNAAKFNMSEIRFRGLPAP